MLKSALGVTVSPSLALALAIAQPAQRWLASDEARPQTDGVATEFALPNP